MTYQYEIKAECETKGGPYGDGFISKDFIIQQSGSIENLIDTFKNEFVNNCPSAIEEKFSERGFKVTFLELKELDVMTVEEGRQHGWAFIKLKVRYAFLIESEQKLNASPFAIEIGEIIKWIVVLILGFIFIHALKEWLMSMGTESWEVIEYDEAGNIIKKESGSKPSWTSAIPLVLIGIAILFGVILFLGGAFKVTKKGLTVK